MIQITPAKNTFNPILLVILGVVYWLEALLFIRFGGEGLFVNGNPWLLLLFVSALPIAWVLVKVSAVVGKIDREDLFKDLDGRINQLDEKIATFQEKSDQIDTLNLTVNQAQSTADDAVNRANNAQDTAKQAISGISSLQTGIQDGSVVALKASMLKARDDNHWLRFNRVDPSDHDVFMLWRNDNTFHPTIRVQASDQLLARNDSHWMKCKGVDKENQDCYGLLRSDGVWFNLIQVAATGNLP